MILQSEIDQVNHHKRIKALLLILTALAVAVVTYVVISAGRDDMKIEPSVIMPKAKVTEVLAPEEVQKQLDVLVNTMPEEPMLQSDSPSEEVEKGLGALSESSDGVTSPPPSQEEIMKSLSILNSK